MKISASMIVRNEAGRYLPLVLDHLLTFVDEVAVINDASTDRTWGLLRQPGVRVLDVQESLFSEHEGRARDRLLEWTLEGKPDWILAIDADEVISDGLRLRELAEAAAELIPTPVAAWHVGLEEAWSLDVENDCICIREDGGWRTHAVPLFYRAPELAEGQWRFRDLRLACPREPPAVASLPSGDSGVELLHLGWLNESERQGRFDRYMAVDGGQYHARQHLESIMWPPEWITLRGRSWPPPLLPFKERIERAGGWR